MEGVKEEVFVCQDQFQLESGGCLEGFELQYATYGELNAKRDNVVWVCHALTGSHEFHVWWDGLFGDGGYYNTKDYYVICANVLGGCYGSSGPLSRNPKSDKPYYHDFPGLTNRDIVAALDLLRKSLGLHMVHTLIGGSLGGQQALEWSIMYPEVFKNLILVATNAQHSPWGIAFNESQRMAIQNDSTWQKYEDDAGVAGMKAARSIALLSYRNYKTYGITQNDPEEDKLDDFRASSYQRYQGEKLAGRFNAFTYWILSKAMDSHNIGRDRGGVAKALATIRARTLVIGVDTDILFPFSEQQFLAKYIMGSLLELINSDYGHDGFLIETKKISEIIARFYQAREIKQKAI